MTERSLEEFLSVVARALGAESAYVVDAADEPPADDVTIRGDLPGARRLIARLAAPPPDASALQRRLEMLAETFADLFPREVRHRPSRPPPSRSLREELAALVQRAGASDAVIIDAHSPVIWGSAGDSPDVPANTVVEELHEGDLLRTPKPPATLHSVGPEDIAAAVQYGLASAQGVRVDPGTIGVIPRAVCARHRILPIARDGGRLVIAMAEPRNADAVHDVVLTTGLDVEPVFAGESMAAFFRHLDDGGDTRTYDEVMAAIPPETRAAREGRALRARDAWARTMRARRAIADVRALPEMLSLHKGGHLRHMVSEPDFGCWARSFAAIYVVILIFEGPFDELLVKRAVTQALPTIERLVAALPPLDPEPPTAGVAALRGRRRR